MSFDLSPRPLPPFRLMLALAPRPWAGRVVYRRRLSPSARVINPAPRDRSGGYLLGGIALA
ncbi:hypothetical protein [Candidatus Amarolinea dominans]|uniref:hypothetical protein n=1 Tax=Candidatus Amarolinea dominans TaxID=3140696 RepID=UPI001E0C49F7|nr:hypothetical protein [Anaerolineae bacterium]